MKYFYEILKNDSSEKSYRTNLNRIEAFKIWRKYKKNNPNSFIYKVWKDKNGTSWGEAIN